MKILIIQNFSKLEQCVRHNTSPIACVTILISNHDEKCNSFFISSKPKFGAISRKKDASLKMSGTVWLTSVF